MSIQSDEMPPLPGVQAQGENDFWEWFDLDVTIVESGPTADTLIQMTDDGCGATCQSACSTSCP